ncbi:MAG TPA: low temperature requirement protein A [Candidatus Limnocylindrales bacterium]|nr:low temperature requirement protein A [Candidatus Limnocylindrales bacterium]
MAPAAESHTPDDVPEGKRVAPLELFYDLVFVFAVTQVSHLLLDDLTWNGAIHAALALGVVWWAWNYTVWVTSEVDLDPVAVRLLFLAMMFASLTMAVAVPDAFDRYGLLFAGAYMAIKLGRLVFLTVGGAHPSAIGPSRGTRLLVWFIASGVLWVTGGIVEGPARVGVWMAALAIDLVGPLVMYWTPGHQRLPYSLWRVELSHLVDRYETFVIIALGETIVLTGATVSVRGFDDERFAALALAFVTTATLYLLYFDHFPRVARRALVRGSSGIHLARDAYMYLHVVLVAGVILSAVGDGLVIERSTQAADAAQVVVICAGPALYLFGHVIFRLRITSSLSTVRLVGAGACVLVGLIGSAMPAVLLSALLVGVLIVVIGAESAGSASVRRPEPA